MLVYLALHLGKISSILLVCKVVHIMDCTYFHGKQFHGFSAVALTFPA